MPWPLPPPPMGSSKPGVFGDLSGYDCGQEEACSQDVTISSVVSKHFWGREISGSRAAPAIVPVACPGRREPRVNLLSPTPVPGSCQHTRDHLYTSWASGVRGRSGRKWWRKPSLSGLPVVGYELSPCLTGSGQKGKLRHRDSATYRFTALVQVMARPSWAWDSPAALSLLSDFLCDLRLSQRL